MNTPISGFSYSLENLLLYTPDMLSIGIGMVAAIILSIFVYYVFLYGQVLILLGEEKRQFEKKKQVLGDLILMKDIQTELEAEIEQAMLKSTFQ